MEENRIVLSNYLAGTLSGNHTITHEFLYPVRVMGAKACATNDSSATLTAADQSSNEIITAAAIGDSGDPAELTPSSTALAAGYDQVAADVQIDWTLDFDGDGGTAAQNVCIQFFYESGSSA